MTMSTPIPSSALTLPRLTWAAKAALASPRLE
jgi:hypothetical protein